MRNAGNYTLAAEQKFWNTQRRLYNIYSGNLPSSAHKIVQMLGWTAWTPPSACWNVFLQRLQLGVATAWNSWRRCGHRRFQTRTYWAVLDCTLLLTCCGLCARCCDVISDPRWRCLSVTPADLIHMSNEGLCVPGLLQHIIDRRNFSDDQIWPSEVPLPFRRPLLIACLLYTSPSPRDS